MAMSDGNQQYDVGTGVVWQSCKLLRESAI